MKANGNRVRGRLIHTIQSKDGVETFTIELRQDGLRVRKKHTRRVKTWPLDSLVNGIVTGQMDFFDPAARDPKLNRKKKPNELKPVS